MISALLFALAAAPSVKVVSGWRVHERYTSCFMETIYKDKTYVMLQYHAPQDTYAMLLSSPLWTDIQDKQRYPVRLGWKGPNQEIAHRAIGIRDEDRPLGMMYLTFGGRQGATRGPRFPADLFRKSDALIVTRADGSRVALDLQGAPDALRQTVFCSRKGLSNRQKTS